MKIKSIYGKPLVKGVVSPEEIEKEKQKALERAGKYALEEIKKEINRAAWKSSPSDLINSFSYEVKDSSIEIKSDHEAVKYQDKGVKPHQMIYLQKAKNPIPIMTEKGEVIFRNASSQSLKGGGWQHPGFKGKNFIDRGVSKAKEKVKEEIKNTYVDLVKKMLKG